MFPYNPPLQSQLSRLIPAVLMIQAVILDYDGTLVSFDREKAFEAALEPLELDPPAVSANLAELDRKRATSGAYSRRALLARVAPGLEEEALQRAEAAFWQRVMETTRPAPGALDLLRHCRENSLPLGLLTDWDGAPGLKQARLEASGLLSWFDAVVIAGETVAARKPRLEPFLEMCSRLNTRPENAIMVGDKVESDLVPARDLGMAAVWIPGEYPGVWSPHVSQLGEVILLLETSPETTGNE